MCGNHKIGCSEFPRVIGSPPRVREPQFNERVAVCEAGITPACAGTTSHDCRHNQASKDHPRVCGNHCCRARQKRSWEGSPPRVREPQKMPLTKRHMMRITPACAGTTRKRIHADPEREDHPRVCGNHLALPRPISVSAGSPPRVREPHSATDLAKAAQGITPACAGTTRRDGGARRGDRDHPRVCGNHTYL